MSPICFNSILSTDADISATGLLLQASAEDVLIISRGEAIASAPTPTVGNRMCGIYTWSQRHLAWVFLTYFRWWNKRGKNKVINGIQNEKSLVEQNMLPIPAYCKQLCPDALIVGILVNKV